MLRAGWLASLGVSSSGWLPLLANEASQPERRRQCILLWMAGGPSQTDTFDMKPGHANGGEFKEIATRVPGLRISEHLPMVALHADQLAVVRSVSTREGDHQRGTYAMRTGHRPGGPIRFPCIGATLAKELHVVDHALPDYFTIDPVVQLSPEAFSPGFLGPNFAPATVGGNNEAPPAPGQFAELRVDNLTLPPSVSVSQAQSRVELWQHLQRGFLREHETFGPVAQDTVYRRALKIMSSRDTEAFDLGQEPDAVRQAYGPTRFGQGCLLARRLIERGVPIVEVTLGTGLGWDTHQDNFRRVRELSNELDLGWGTLMSELKERGLLETTTILWMGEFGRTPNINSQAGRDHFPNAWTCVFAGGGIRGGQYYGRTSDDGMEVAADKVSEADVLATLCQALGIDPNRENVSPEGRPIRLAEGAVIDKILA
ncbi:MAG: DUF1501 domain-containing protein [Planctomycetales bacterium]|nr:DUF1501 domain-containing protein [Planctomycetales bacterium]